MLILQLEFWITLLMTDMDYDRISFNLIMHMNDVDFDKLEKIEKIIKYQKGGEPDTYYEKRVKMEVIKLIVFSKHFKNSHPIKLLTRAMNQSAMGVILTEENLNFVEDHECCLVRLCRQLWRVV